MSSPTPEKGSAETKRRRSQVLLVEDAPSLGRLFSDALIHVGLDVEWVPDVDQAIAAALARPPDLLVLDAQLRGRSGVQLLGTIQDAGAAQTPVLVMSTSPEQDAANFAPLGVKECLAKPFPPDVLALRCRFLVCDDGVGGEDDTSPFVVVAEEDSGESSGRFVQPVLAALGGALQRALESRLSSALGTEISREGGEKIIGIASEIAAQVLDDERVRPLLPSAGIAFQGDLTYVSLVQVVQLLAVEQQTGLLTVENGADKAEFVFSDGRVDLGVLPPAGERELLARVLATGALLDIETARKQVARLEAHSSVVTQAVASELVTMSELRRCVAETTRRALFDVLQWREGRFYFGPLTQISALASEVGRSLNIDELLMEGARRIDEWHIIEKLLPDPSVVFVREELRLTQSVLDGLTTEEYKVLELVDGRTTIEEILERVAMPSYDVHSLLHRLLTLRLVRPRTRPVVLS